MTASVVAAVAVGCALHSGASALAAPEQGGVIPHDGPEQGGVLPDDSGGGNTPQQQPAPAPQPAPGPSYDGPGVLPSPPMDAPYEPLTYQPSYPDAYNPLPSTPLTPPKRVKPVRPIQAPPNTWRLGNEEFPVKSVPPQPVNVLPGMAIGAGVGFATGVAATVAVAALAGAGGAVLGAAIGLGLAYALGTGDPGKNPRQPTLPWQQHGPNRPSKPNSPHQPAPGPTVYRVQLAAPDARRAGLPAVDYQVNLRGDVNASARVGSQTVRAQIPAAVAKPVYDALGPRGKATADRLTKQAADQLQRAVPGLKITAPPAPVTPHRKGKRP